MVAARSVVTRGASAAALRVGDGEGEHPARREALGDGREQELGGDEADGAEDGVDRVEVASGVQPNWSALSSWQRSGMQVAE
ncbi:hypothetical protein AMK31_10720 [Streptomyces sp. TSRI0107]|nr:hypothetical protein AMK31_10720 [Streptomyces sp. TSRI0107]